MGPDERNAGRRRGMEGKRQRYRQLDVEGRLGSRARATQGCIQGECGPRVLFL